MEREKTSLLPLALRNWLRTSVWTGKKLNRLSSHKQRKLPCDAAESKSFASKPAFCLNRQIQVARCLSGYACVRDVSWGGGKKPDVEESLSHPPKKLKLR